MNVTHPNYILITELHRAEFIRNINLLQPRDWLVPSTSVDVILGTPSCEDSGRRELGKQKGLQLLETFPGNKYHGITM